MTDFLWKEAILKNQKHLAHQLSKLQEEKKAIDGRVSTVESNLLNERIKSFFNLENTEKTVDGFKRYHATRGWVTEGYESAIYNVRTNKNAFYRCEIPKERLPDECFPFYGDGYYYDNDRCAKVLTYKNTPCLNWQKSAHNLPLPPKEKSTWSFEEGMERNGWNRTNKPSKT